MTMLASPSAFRVVAPPNHQERGERCSCRVNQCDLNSRVAFVKTALTSRRRPGAGRADRGGATQKNLCSGREPTLSIKGFCS